MGIFDRFKRTPTPAPAPVPDAPRELLGIKIPSFLLRRYSLASVTHTCQRLWTPQA